jgi:D-alanyl-D-alanine carboxypeptidase (penicillin-binding protein 5/6)
MSVSDLLKAVAVASANDATVALAEKVAGSEAAFVDMMNRRADELGLKNTHFMNSNGLDEENHFTSARDTAVIACELLKYKLITQFTTIWMDTLRGGKSELVNTNRLVRFYSGITGLKTGTTNKAGSCLVASAERSEFALVAVVMGADNSDRRFASARTLLDYGYANYTLYKPAPPDLPIQVKIKGGTSETVEAIPDGLIPIVMPKGYEKTITYSSDIKLICNAPVEEGQILGRVTIKADGNEIGSYNLCAQKAVSKMTIWAALWRLMTDLIKF